MPLGKWKYEKSQGHDDYGLVISEKAKKYGISYNLPHVVDPNEKTLTLQYDVRFQKGINCGGAYLKFILPKVSSFFILVLFIWNQFKNTINIVHYIYISIFYFIHIVEIAHYNIEIMNFYFVEQ